MYNNVVRTSYVNLRETALSVPCSVCDYSYMVHVRVSCGGGNYRAVTAAALYCNQMHAILVERRIIVV